LSLVSASSASPGNNRQGAACSGQIQERADNRFAAQRRYPDLTETSLGNKGWCRGIASPRAMLVVCLQKIALGQGLLSSSSPLIIFPSDDRCWVLEKTPGKGDRLKLCDKGLEFRRRPEYGSLGNREQFLLELFLVRRSSPRVHAALRYSLQIVDHGKSRCCSMERL